ncbi:pentapeptide repeat-containing protein [Dactylosporangium sp. NPDC048998]|uniref:pentapeptide repeat-containing protein n=1 Tax=Dactylosporangium sp. NPDC048998 TaxID=3363976 RepID=UPI00372356AC
MTTKRRRVTRSGTQMRGLWSWLRDRRQRLLLPVGMFLLITGIASVLLGWWDHYVWPVAVGTGRHWLSVLLFSVGAAAIVAWTAGTRRRRRWPGRVRRGRREPIAVWLPLSAHIGGLLLLSVAVAIGMGALLWWALGKPPVNALPTTPTAAQGAPTWTVSNTFEAMKIVLSIVAGIGAVVALTVAYRKQDQGEAAEHREETKLFNDRFGKAADQLGSDKAAVRLAGVYAMAGLADDWREGRQTCIDVLCAYVRMPWPELPAQSPPDAAVAPAEDGSTNETPAVTTREFAEERQVRHTIIRVIRDRLRPGKPGDVDRWHGHHFDFSRAEFHGGDLSNIEVTDETNVDFGGATFLGNIMLRFLGAKFSGGTVSFTFATFSGGTLYFPGATFSGSTVRFGAATFSDGAIDFNRATFSGGEVDFVGTAFSGGEVDFDHATFSGSTVDFMHATFSGSMVNFANATFSGGMVGFVGATFSGGMVQFERATFSGSLVNFGVATFSGGTVSLGYVRFSKSTVYFFGATFSGGTVRFVGATFSGGMVQFDNAMFSRGTVYFVGATFSGGKVDFGSAGDWSVPPIGLPTASAFVVLPAGHGDRLT